MADLEHITIDGTRYDIADAEARKLAEENAETLEGIEEVSTATIDSWFE